MPEAEPARRVGRTSHPSLRGPLPERAPGTHGSVRSVRVPPLCWLACESSDQAFAICLENILYLIKEEALGYWHAYTEN